jgi:hypothetical protein
LLGGLLLFRRVDRFLELSLNLFDRRQRSLQSVRKGLKMPELRDTHGCGHVAQCVLRDDSILCLAQDHTDARLIVGVSQQVVDSGKVEVHFAGILGLERGHFEIDNHKTPQLEMVEK